MKEIVALSTFLLVAGLAIFLGVRGRIGKGLTAILLAFSLASGLAIANYERVGSIRWEVPGFKPFQEQVAAIKTGAVEEIKKEGEEQRRSVETLVDSARQAQIAADNRMKSVELLLEDIRKGEERLRAREQRLQDLADSTERMRNQIADIQRTMGDLALLLTRVVWLQLESRNQSGKENADATVQRIKETLDEIVTLVIPDPRARSEFVNDVMGMRQE